MRNNPASSSGVLSGFSFELLVQSVIDYAIFMLDPEGYIASWNPGAQRAKGYQANEIIGKHFSIFYTAEDIARNHPEHELEIAIAEGRYEEQGWRVRKDGTRFWANVVITAVRDQQGRLVGFGKVTRDLTERRLQEARALELERKRVAAESSNQAKTDFLRTMSHELRTPLNAIIGYLDLLDAGVHGQLTAGQHDVVVRVRRSSRVLLGLINDVLNISQIEEGRVDYRLEEFPIDRVLDELELLMAAQYQQSGIRLVVGRAPDVKVHADYEKTLQIMLNLLSNAWKFTSPGGEVNVAAAGRPGFATIVIRDTGRGIPAEQLATIFERFVQVDRHLTEQSQQGVGLGLSISRALARGMKGEITAESVQGEGATFTVTLPSP